MKYLLFPLLLLFVAPLIAQENLSYQKPPTEILELVDVPLAPGVIMDVEAENMILLYRDTYKSLATLSEKEMRLAGLRINPNTNIGSRTTYYKNLKVQKVSGGEAVQIDGLPEEPRLSNFNWSPDQTKIACTNTVEAGVEVWVLDVASASVKKITEANVNANMGNPIRWLDDEKMLVKFIPKDRQDLINTGTSVPAGPTISKSDGAKAQNRTYQDLLKNNIDEHNFEQLAYSELHQVDLNGGSKEWMESAMYSSVSLSPDRSYVMVTTIHRPFSYIVPYYRFPQKTVVYERSGKQISVVNEIPLIEEMPKGFMAVRTGRRSMQWRSDRPSTLVWTEALDGGDPEMEVEYRDEVFQMDAPFRDGAVSLLKTQQRFNNIQWASDEMAIATDYWWNTRNLKTYIFNPSDQTQEPKLLYDRNYQDRYSDPGSFVSKRNEYGRSVLEMDKNNLFLMGAGYSDEGQFPFIDKLSLKDLSTKRLYQSAYTDKKESLNSAIDMKNGEILVRIESPTEYPNYYIRNIKKDDLQQVTAFTNPFKSLQDVHKEVIKYKRDDGLELSGTLYLPVGYDMDAKEKMPMIMWAYPREFKDKNSASQSTSNPNSFIYPYYGSMVYWVTRGYVVLDNAAFPIIGEKEDQPNDTFIPQLVANAKAAIDAVDELGYIDRDRVAVGGHSYGAFMTANLLTHSNLFAAGIARSGAYNRTLTPFGFQSEERSYWEAPDVYNTMSPFMNADKMKTPLLLVHGEADNNSGTYPMQSERYFNALKGMGATARLVILPKESHGYAAKESILHLLWEQDQWLEKYVKNRVMEEPENK
ncbi:MAG: prolyl oligopeptidase family serine peptidase [Bacteroidia bacterium]